MCRYLRMCRPSLHVCACIFMYINIYRHVYRVFMRVCKFTCTHADLRVRVYILTYMHAEFAGACVSIYMYVG